MRDDVRFGYRDQKEPLNSEVKTYTLSEEELENYRKGETKMKLTKELYLQEKENKVTDSEIKKKYGLNQNHLYDFKKKNDLIGKLPKVNAKDEAVKPKEKIEPATDWELKFKHIKGELKLANERIKLLEEENQRLDDENADLQNQLDKVTINYDSFGRNVETDEEPDIGWEEMKDELAATKAKYEKLVEYVKVVM